MIFVDEIISRSCVELFCAIRGSWKKSMGRSDDAVYKKDANQNRIADDPLNPAHGRFFGGGNPYEAFLGPLPTVENQFPNKWNIPDAYWYQADFE